jgi:aminopeptidase N
MKLFTFLFFLMLMMTEISCAQNPPTIEPGVSQTLAKWRAANYSDVRYKLNLALEKQAPLMQGTIEIRVNLSEEGAKNPLLLDWRTTQFANDKDKPSARVTEINGTSLLNSNESVYAILNEHLQIGNQFFKTGENVIKIEFSSPIKTSGAAITRYTDKEDGAEYLYSLFVPSDASTAFPLFDQPDLKAKFTLEVTSKTFDRVVSNSIGKTSDYNTNTDRFTFAETQPISTYVFAFAAGDFVDFQENRPVNEKGESIKDLAMEGNRENFRVFVRRSQAEKFKAHEKEVFRLTREGVKYLESYFDYKFPFPKYDTVLIPEFPFGGMEHAGATFLRESSIIFPSEPTKNDYISRANLIFHEAAHQWFGDTVTMKWFDDLWLKEGFAEFMAYKTLEKVLPEYNAWKAFYERNKPLAYLTDATKGTTPIYQEIPNLSAAKSAYGNIVYRKAPAFLRQAEFYLGEQEFQTAVRAFLKKHEYANAEWTDLVKEFKTANNKINGEDLTNAWIKQRGLFKIQLNQGEIKNSPNQTSVSAIVEHSLGENLAERVMKFKVLVVYQDGTKEIRDFALLPVRSAFTSDITLDKKPVLVFPNYQDYGYGIFLLDAKSRDYVLKNIQNEKDDFLRSMMWEHCGIPSEKPN